MTLAEADEIDQHNRTWAARSLWGGMIVGFVAMVLLVQPASWLGVFTEPVAGILLVSSLVGGGCLGVWLFKRYWRREHR